MHAAPGGCFSEHPKYKKRPFSDSPSALSPPNLPPLAQRIRSDFQIGESEPKSPVNEILRSSPCPENPTSPISPGMKGFPSPAPLVFTPLKALPEKSSCMNCDGEMTPDHQCEALDSDSGLPDPLPVCHYCCHRGSGDYPVHYYQQCMCDDSPCTCLCYCTGAQLEHKHRVFPSRFWGKTCDSVNVPKAKALADERTQRLRGYSPNCTHETCVRYMKEDGLYLPESQLL